MQPITDKKIFSSSLWSYNSTAITFLLTFFFSILIVRYLSPEDYGSYKLIFSIGAVLTFIASFGVEKAIARYIPEYIEKKHYLSVNRLVFIAIFLRFIGVSFLLFLSNFFSDWYFAFFNFTTLLKSWYLVICIFLLISQLYQVFGIAFLNAYLEIKKNSLVKILKSFLMVLMLGIVILYDLEFRGIVLMILMTELLTFTIYGIMGVRKIMHNSKIGREVITKPAPFEYRRVGKFMMFSYILSGMNVFRDIAVDNFVISHYLGMKQVGLYAFAVTFVTLINSFNPGVILKSVFNYLFIRKYTQTNDTADLIYGNSLIIKLCSFIMFPLYVILSVMAKPIIIYIYSSEYLPALPVIYCLAFFFSLRCFVQGIGLIISTLEILHIRIFAIIFSLYNLIMDIVLVKYIGILGAAIATGSALLLTIVFYYLVIIFYVKIKIGFPLVAIMKILFNAFIVSVLLMYFKSTVKDLTSLLLALLSGIVIYLCISYFNKPFNEKDRNYINRVIGRRVWVF